MAHIHKLGGSIPPTGTKGKVMTDFQKFLHLLDEWRLVNENLHVYGNEDIQTKSLWVFTDIWVFDRETEKFLYVEDVEYGTYLHRGGEVKQTSGREHLYEN